MWGDGVRLNGMRFKTIVAVLALVALLSMGVSVLAQTPQRGGELIVGNPTDPDFWDPHRVTAAQSLEILWLLYDTLTIMDWDAATVQPHIATSWDISEDGTTYTFHLRDDVYFHSGRHMTADDWVWTYNERLLDPNSGSLHGWRLGDVKRIEAVDTYTLEIELNEPFSELLVQLTFAFLGVVDREMVQQHGANYGITYAGGTGPFKWGSWEPGEELVLLRNDAYTWGPAIHDNPGPVHIDAFRRRVIPEKTTMYFELELGTIDVVLSVDAGELDHLMATPGIKMVEIAPRPSVEFFGFKTTRPLMKDLAVRRAVSHAIDRQELVEAIYYGWAVEPKGFVLPDTPGYSKNAENLWAYYDPVEARRLLDEAGWAVGSDGIRVKDGQRLRLTLLLTLTALNEEMALVLQAQLRDVGIDLEINLADGNAFWGLTTQDIFDIYMLNYGYTTVHDILNNYFHSGNMPSPNRQGFVSDRIDSLLEMSLVETDEELRFSYLQEVQDILAENAVWVPFAHLRSFRATGEHVHGFRLHGQYLMSMSKLLDVWVEK